MERVKDPVCGMMVSIEEGRPAFHHGTTYYLCSDLCQRIFLADPDKYAGRTTGLSGPTRHRSEDRLLFHGSSGGPPHADIQRRARRLGGRHLAILCGSQDSRRGGQPSLSEGLFRSAVG